MVEPFSAKVSGAAWRADVEEWVHDRVDDHGHRITGPLDQRRISAWSTQLVVPTDAGPVWFKALCPSMAFEPALQDLLATVVPEEVDRPYAIDPRRGWMMTTDRGSTLAESHEPTLDDWHAVVATAAHLQREIATHREEVLATGVEDCSPGTVPRRFEMLVDRFSALPPDHPSHVDDDLRTELLATLPRLVDACAQIEASPMPVTLQHGDLHPGNVFATGESRSRSPDRRSLRVFDFGDAQWAPALEVLSVPYGILTEAGTWPFQSVLDAYTDAWHDVVDVRSMHALWQATAFTQPVNRSLTWSGALTGATDQEVADWGIAPLHHLRRVLDA
ncbi:phosphotransferase [Aeromicrobium sp.]|uniref:phosphotransferase n=1 Tax=Aeromicrobium sp. TaxID=1871063 RepID=UPI003C6190E0